MVVGDLVCLSEGVVIGDSGAVVSEASEVRLRALLLFNVDCHNFDLVVRKSNFNFKFVGHHKLICLDRVVVVLLLLNLLLVVKIAFLIDGSLDVIGVLHHLDSNLRFQ